MKFTVEIDINEPELASMREMARRYKHGWHTADLIVRQDAKELRWEADWVRQILTQLPNEARD